MFNKIQHFFQNNTTALDILAYRQEILSSNIANADTPNYQAKDINFKNELQKAMNNDKNHIGKLKLKLTSVNHITEPNNNLFKITKNNDDQYHKDKLYNNSVNMNQERIKFIENAIKYQTYLTLLNNQIKNMYNVIQG